MCVGVSGCVVCVSDYCSQPQALDAWEYVGSVVDEMERRGDSGGGLQLEESAFQLLFAAVGLDLFSEPSTAAETVQVCMFHGWWQYCEDCTHKRFWPFTQYINLPYHTHTRSSGSATKT